MRRRVARAHGRVNAGVRRAHRRPAARTWARRSAAGALLLGALVAALLAVARDAAAQRVPPEGARYAASTRGRVYYWIGCDAWRRLAPENLVFFGSAAEAEAAGYRPSRTAGCGRRPEEATSPGARAPLPAGASAAGGASASGADGAARRAGGGGGGVAAAPYRPDSAGAVTRPSPPAAPTVDCTIARVVDGDTIDCREFGRVRLLLVDAPEMSQRPWGVRARDALTAMLPVGAVARLELDVQERDRYGRLLAYVYDPAWRMVNEALVRAGYALVAVYPPNVKHVERVRAAAVAAREGRRGLWATPAFECAPADHRRGRCEE
ncbi:MAG TPA: thermonuclease family protein [Longimicrobiales bacterium]